MKLKETNYIKKVLSTLCIVAICLLTLELVTSMVALVSGGLSKSIVVDVFRDVFAICFLSFVTKTIFKKEKS